MRPPTTLLIVLLAALVAPLGLPRAQDAAAPAASEPGFDHTHAVWTKVLRKHVGSDGVDYAKLKRDRGELDAYLASLRAVTPDELASWTREQRFAFWINVYNAHVVALIVDNYPVASIQSLGTLMTKVWKRDVVPLPALDPQGEGEALSLDEVEHEILRPRFQDARVHAAVNCASESCPPLRAEAFVAERLDAQLTEQVQRWLADDALNRYDRTATRIDVSRLFEWFERDFLAEAGSVQAWIAHYAPAEHRSWIQRAKSLKIEYLEYSWALNDASPR